MVQVVWTHTITPCWALFLGACRNGRDSRLKLYMCDLLNFYNNFFPFCFSKTVFPAEYGAQYDSDLQTLFLEFLYRLGQLLPVPDLEQVSCVSLCAVVFIILKKT